ncbi:MAG: prolyl oligopeptidase family serine peptidase, partial [Gracilimonas sp.]|nr:prolyl oligopeptidase family serine peptidase [Gracilimonas sp.]
ETITWTSYDGMQIEGLLIYPIDYKEGEEYPLFLNVHGGPGGVYSNTFLGSGAFYNAAFFAHHGYAVLKPNPRGSSGYGKEFRYANFQDLGEGDYEDIMSGVDEVIEMGIADPDQLVMAGWSYGGYMAARIATKTDRFKAISMGAGLFNLESMFVTTDVIDYGLGLMGGGYWESDELKEVYKKLSPHTMVDEVTTPVQLLHSSNDQRVPASQSFEMYQVLKRMDVPTELVLYPRSGHGPSEPKLSVDVGMRVLDWFDTYLDRADM